MSFQDWFQPLNPATFAPDVTHWMQGAWDAATLAERERCIEQVKKVLHTGPDTLGDDIINAIRGQDAQRSV